MKCRDNWEEIFETFGCTYPKIYEQVVEWYPSGYLEITVILENGTKMAYGLINDVLTTVFDPKEKHGNWSDDDWRINFSRKLNKLMLKHFISQEELSVKTGISRVTLSKYQNGKAVPSGANISRIAEVLQCSVNELTSMY